MVAEDNRQKWNKDHEHCMAIVRHHLHHARLEQDDLHERISTLIDALNVTEDELDEQKHINYRLETKLAEEVPFQKRSFLPHSRPNDTEMHDRRKFIRFGFHS